MIEIKNFSIFPETPQTSDQDLAFEIVLQKKTTVSCTCSMHLRQREHKRNKETDTATTMWQLKKNN